MFVSALAILDSIGVTTLGAVVGLGVLLVGIMIINHVLSSRQ